MPFRSEQQRRFLWANHPDIAQRWSNEYGSKSMAKKLTKAQVKKVAERKLELKRKMAASQTKSKGRAASSPYGRDA